MGFFFRAGVPTALAIADPSGIFGVGAGVPLGRWRGPLAFFHGGPSPATMRQAILVMFGGLHTAQMVLFGGLHTAHKHTPTHTYVYMSTSSMFNVNDV